MQSLKWKDIQEELKWLLDLAGYFIDYKSIMSKYRLKMLLMAKWTIFASWKAVPNKFNNNSFLATLMMFW